MGFFKLVNFFPFSCFILNGDMVFDVVKSIEPFFMLKIRSTSRLLKFLLKLVNNSLFNLKVRRAFFFLIGNTFTLSTLAGKSSLRS